MSNQKETKRFLVLIIECQKNCHKKEREETQYNVWTLDSKKKKKKTSVGMENSKQKRKPLLYIKIFSF